MKRAHSIFFLLLMLLNTFGYYGALVIIEQQNFTRAITKITENQDEISGNLLLRIPMPLSSSHNDNEYSRAYGEIVVDGQLYHYVKQKLYQDTLYIVCLKDSESTEVRNTISDYSKTFSHQHPTKSESTSKGVVITLTKFHMPWDESIQSNGTILISNILRCGFVHNLYAFSSVASIFHPPC